jgi:predicted signal transduction protein with EAL and GGDEF domain
MRNRRGLTNDLAEQIVDASPQNPLLLLCFVSTGFKAYHDVYGHPAGDALLTRLGTALTRAVDGRGSTPDFRVPTESRVILVTGGHTEAIVSGRPRARELWRLSPGFSGQSTSRQERGELPNASRSEGGCGGSSPL